MRINRFSPRNAVVHADTGKRGNIVCPWHYEHESYLVKWEDGTDSIEPSEKLISDPKRAPYRTFPRR